MSRFSTILEVPSLRVNDVEAPAQGSPPAANKLLWSSQEDTVKGRRVVGSGLLIFCEVGRIGDGRVPCSVWICLKIRYPEITISIDDDNRWWCHWIFDDFKLSRTLGEVVIILARGRFHSHVTSETCHSNGAAHSVNSWTLHRRQPNPNGSSSRMNFAHCMGNEIQAIIFPLCLCLFNCTESFEAKPAMLNPLHWFPHWWLCIFKGSPQEHQIAKALPRGQISWCIIIIM